MRAADLRFADFVLDLLDEPGGDVAIDLAARLSAGVRRDYLRARRRVSAPSLSCSPFS